jgi:hypothetical protein
VTFADFLGRNAIVVGFLLLVAGGGLVVALLAGARESRSFATGVAALLCALTCVGVGMAQRSALLDASASVATMAGLSRGDRDRIMREKLADAGYALEFAVLAALLPLVAGGVAVARAMRARRS